MQSIHMSFLGLTIEVSSEEIASLEWIQEFFHGSFGSPTERDSKGATMRIDHINDSRKLEELRRICQSSNDSIAAFVLDSGVQRLPCVRTGEQSVFAYSAFQNIAYGVAETTQVVKDDLGKTDEHSGRGGLMRAVREFAMDHAWRSGYSILHGSAFVIDGVATAFVGDKNSGKTTALCGCLTLIPKSEFLANDRIVVGVMDEGVVAYGLPTIISIRNGGAMLVDSLNKKLSNLSTQYDGSPLSDKDLSGRHLLTTRGFCSMMNCGLRSKARLKNLVFPVIEEDEKGFILRKLSKLEVQQRLPVAAFARGHLQEHTEIFSMPKSGPIASEFEKSERLTSVGEKLDCYELRMGPGFYTREAMGKFVRLISD
jgi:hypothetical protein